MDEDTFIAIIKIWNVLAPYDSYQDSCHVTVSVNSVLESRVNCHSRQNCQTLFISGTNHSFEELFCIS